MLKILKNRLNAFAAGAYKAKVRRRRSAVPDIPMPERALLRTLLFPSRFEMHEYVRRTHFPGVVAEIGVEDGRHAVELIKALRPETLYLVDIWPDVEQMIRCKEFVRAAAEGIPQETEIIFHRESSFDWIPRFAKYMDYIYLDTSHTFGNTLRELVLLAESNPRPLIGGHDYNAGANICYGVIPAVHKVLRDWEMRLEALTLECKTGRSFLIS